MVRKRDTQLNVVLFPLAECTIDFLELTEQWFGEQFAINSLEDIQIIRKTASCIRISCKQWATKRYLLSWTVRSAALEHFDIQVKEDLFRHERIQKRAMWPVMNTLYAAYFFPRWNRSSLVWKYQDKWFEIQPGEIPTDFTASQIEDYCDAKCRNLSQARSSAATVSSVQQRAVEQRHLGQFVTAVEKSTQTQHTGEPKLQQLHNSVYSMLQEVSTAKMKTARKQLNAACCAGS